jgi:glycosidase
MQWRRGPAAGFTTGLPWEPLQPDSLTANVEAHERDEKSLLNLYRRLIHLRASNPALAVGALVPLTTTNDAVVAFLRRDDKRDVLVVANLAKEPARNVAISSAEGALAPGEYRLTSLLGDAVTETIAVGSEASNGCVLVASIAPMTSSVLELSVAKTAAPRRVECAFRSLPAAF